MVGEPQAEGQTFEIPEPEYTEASISPIYSNNIRMTTSPSELILDFLYVFPEPSVRKTPKFMQQHKCRVVLPLRVAGQLLTLLEKRVQPVEVTGG